MPRVKIDYVVSFSSEDKEHPASNLLAWEINKKKWLCKEGEPSCSVVLQLEKAVQIESVNIGVHHAALLEVLVGMSEKPHDPFEVLVPSCVVVSAAESRRDVGVERVRSFSSAQLADAGGRRWDRLRVVCSQPYNKRVQYGLTFVHVYSGGGEAAPALPPRLLTLDSLSSDEDEFRPGELFAQRHLLAPPATSPSPAPANTGAQIRLASSHALNNISATSTKLVKTPIVKTSRRQDDERLPQHDRRRDGLVYTDDDGRPHQKIDRVVRAHNEQKGKGQGERKSPPRDGGPVKRKSPPSDGGRQVKRKSPSGEGGRPAKRDKIEGQRLLEQKDSPPNTTQVRTPNTCEKPQSKQTGGPPLAGVVFSISGYENPRRARVRDAAVALGARYEPHALQRCTHLVCAFPNTPKLRELQRVSPAARAVRAEWVEHCAAARARPPEPPYAPGLPLPPAPPPATTHADPASDADTDDEIERAIRGRVESDAERDEPDAKKSASDTDQDAAKQSTNHNKQRKEDAVRDEDNADTDTDEPPPICRQPQVLPALFCGDLVSLDPRLPRRVRALLARYLRAYGALVADADELDADSAVSLVVSERGDGDAGGVPPGAARVTPRWVWRCHRKQRRCALPDG